MKLIYLLGFTLAAPLALAQSNPALWMAMPYASIVLKCSSAEPQLRQSFSRAIEEAKQKKLHRIPAPILSLLEQATEASANQTLTAQERLACIKTADVIASDSFMAVLRTQAALLFLSEPIASCTKPGRPQAGATRDVVVRTSKRLGLLITDTTIDELISQRPNASASDEICKSLIEQIQGEEFSESYSEDGFIKLFQAR